MSDYFFPNSPLKIKLKIEAPIFLSIPCSVVGMPVCRAMRCFAPVIPNNLFQENENPNLLMVILVISYFTITIAAFALFTF